MHALHKYYRHFPQHCNRPASNLLIIIHRLIHHPPPSSHPSTNPSKPSAEPPSLHPPSADPSASSETLPLVHHKPPTYTPGGHIPGLCPSSKAALLGCVVTRISTAWQRR
ncbi:hypothetical protein HBI67_010240 [Parastagonospora nodorum]|nr:hypothetical protein HBI66_109200 [Parastagonospora nodorum]KAH6086194.1 hypothetical protein HBI67_010240 [Parastagonospora nodorum]